MKRYFLLFIGYCLFFFSCKENTTPQVNYYYDAKKFFVNEAQRLNNLKPIVDKQVILNANKENKSVTIENWENEFHAFAEIDINKPAFIGKYKTDTIWQQQQIKSLQYQALNNNLKVQKVLIEFDSIQYQPKKIEATIMANNTLYQSTQVLMYETNKKYSVKGTQKIKFLSPDSFEVNGIFKN